jgi:DNA-binding NarL/FixJ family response regulator
MSRVGKFDEHGVSSGGKGEHWSRRTLLIVTADDVVSECLVYAIKREFPFISVEQVPTLDAVCSAFEHPVALILVDTAFLCEIGKHAQELCRRHPTALTALLQNDNRTPVSFQDIIASKVVRSVLPMDLKLDVWLSVIRLMLRGGEYFPFAMFQSYVNHVVEGSSDLDRAVQLTNTVDVGLDDLTELTEREFQILEMVSRGLQNKIIAASLRLSEYTVKIHLHHIITKLGAHNRTEAAAIFHDRKDTFSGARERSRVLRFSPSSV